jgi:NAD-dependent dihydropyrimidine dehydrogenase PreA subunit
MGRFIEITVTDPALDAAHAQAVLDGCPVDIFILDQDTLRTVEDREDECILCARCIVAAPGAVTVRRRYGAHAALSPQGDADDA